MNKKSKNMKTLNDILKLIKENDIKIVDINGQFRHVTIPAKNFLEKTMKNGIGFSNEAYRRRYNTHHRANSQGSGCIGNKYSTGVRRNT